MFPVPLLAQGLDLPVQLLVEPVEFPAHLGAQGLELGVEARGVGAELFADRPALGQEGVPESLLLFRGLLADGFDLRCQGGPPLLVAGFVAIEPDRGPSAELGLGDDSRGHGRDRRRLAAPRRDDESGAGRRLFPLGEGRAGRRVRGLGHRPLDDPSVVRRRGFRKRRGHDLRGGRGRRDGEFRKGHGVLRGVPRQETNGRGGPGTSPFPHIDTDGGEFLPTKGRIFGPFRISRTGGRRRRPIFG